MIVVVIVTAVVAVVVVDQIEDDTSNMPGDVTSTTVFVTSTKVSLR